MTAKAKGRVRFVGFIAGAGLMLGFAFTQRLPVGHGSLDVHVSVATARAGELIATPPGRFVADSTLRPGGDAAGSVTLRNPTAVTLAVRPRAVRRRGELDRLLDVEVRAPETAFQGSLAALRRGNAREFRIPAGGSLTVRVRVLFPATSAKGWEGRSEAMRLDWLTRIVRR